VEKEDRLRELEEERDRLKRAIHALDETLLARAKDGIESLGVDAGAGSRRVKNIPLQELLTIKESYETRLVAVKREIDDLKHDREPNRFIQVVFP